MESLLLTLGPLVFWGTPVAAIVWIVRRRRQPPPSSLAPGYTVLALWVVLLLAVLVLALFSMGGHSGIVGELLGAAILAACAALLGFLYWKR